MSENSVNFSVQYLKTICFSSLSLEEKIKIKSAGRPKPNLLITNITKCKTRDYKRHFKVQTYEKSDWLCGCDVNNSLYCFPCLLFVRDDQTEWTKSGVKDLIHLAEKIKKHESSKAHLTAKLGFNLLGKQDIRQQLNSAYRMSIEKHNEEVKNNRYVLSKIINCVKFCGAFELALLGHDEGKHSLNPGLFKGLINFSAELDLALREHLQQATVFKGTSKDIQNDLLNCMLCVCQAHIKKEISASKFVSIISDETSDISNTYQMVAVFRYTLTNGTPVERFWSFLNPSDHNATALSDCIENLLNSVLKQTDQLISQSYDGASVMSGVHNGVQKLIKDKFNDITNFFSNSPQRVAILDEVVGSRIPKASTTRWNFKIRTVNIVYENREALIECMEKIQYTSRQSDTIIKAGALLRLLNDSKFVFWLTVFHRLMPHVDILYSQLQKRTTDSVTIKQSIKSFEESIQKERDNIHTIRDFEVNDLTLKITNLFLIEHFEMYSLNFPEEYLNSAIRAFPFLDKNKLKTELEIIYRRPDFRENNLHLDFSETCLVLHIIVTMPMTTAEAERCFSTLQRIKTFLRSTMSQDRLAALPMLSIEKQMIQNIPNFNELVIEEFISKKDRRLQFQYKTCL
ncbi:hypothetical protein RN001_007569 [Aquatica leii]|uniref:Zinc finger MYM-type protein 1-like n=1 Tax=Aquatica leii TaxID=1421715 RepID=A0AAN7QIE2_9COLE|nr:hypothetical protein RN001_007569 [Aquatica leii]